MTYIRGEKTKYKISVRNTVNRLDVGLLLNSINKLNIPMGHSVELDEGSAFFRRVSLVHGSIVSLDVLNNELDYKLTVRFKFKEKIIMLSKIVKKKK